MEHQGAEGASWRGRKGWRAGFSGSGRCSRPAGRRDHGPAGSAVGPAGPRARQDPQARQRARRRCWPQVLRPAGATGPQVRPARQVLPARQVHGPTGATGPAGGATEFGLVSVFVDRGSGPTRWMTLSVGLAGSPAGTTTSGTFRFTCSPAAGAVQDLLRGCGDLDHVDGADGDPPQAVDLQES